ncbi:9177_t:CDS:2 [Scutellospora calospora]|uniref:9177_t:CDS:1 n=1 Tax=Scutellospora calospora TaxID=85575 RepID=A0ACA9K731_9GLOM|nr:9177_t:CDS:2 [Scutellospora calospora]
MSSTINCFWSLLSLSDLSFVYISPWLSKALGPDHDSLLGTSVFDYFHPQDRELARRDLSDHDIVLACFHPDDVKPSHCTQISCGETEFSKEELNKLSSLLHKYSTIGSSRIQTPPFSDNHSSSDFNAFPNRIFQILDKHSKNLIFSWPDPTFVAGTELPNVSYDKFEFSKLLQDASLNSSNIITGKDRIDVQSESCLRLFSNKHIIMSASGKYQKVESVMIPYGVIIFACFQILPSASSTLSFCTSPTFKHQKSLSAPCSPITANGLTKRPRSPGYSPGSLSPTSYSDSGSNSIAYHYRPDTSERSIKRIRLNNNDLDLSVRTVPHLLPNPISPHDSPGCKGNVQYPFPSISQPQNDQTLPQSLPTISQQIYFNQSSQQHFSQHAQQHTQQHVQQHVVTPYSSPTFLPHDNNNAMCQRPNPPPFSQPQPVPNQQPPTFPPFSPSQRRNNAAVNGTKKCESCHTSSSPEWRRGPTGHKTLCNACGLRYSRTIAREIRKREQAQREQEQRFREQREGEERARERAAAIMMQYTNGPQLVLRLV